MTQDDAVDMPARQIDQAEAAMVGLVKVDYDATLRALNGFTTAAAAIRGIGIATWGVILGFAVGGMSPALAVLAAGITFVFAFIDGYLSALYRGALARAIWIESLLNDYAETLGISADDAEAVDQVRARLELHPFGVNRTMRRLAFGDVFDARPWPVFVVLYPALITAAVAVFIVYAA